MANYLGITPDQGQKFGVEVLDYFILLSGDTTPTRATLPTMGTATTYTTDWSPTELPTLEAVKTKYMLDDTDAQRLGIYVLSYILALQGH
jgi:hypothetical protein